MPKVRTTMQPLVELDVTEKEARDLAREGILLVTTATTHDALIADAVEQSEARPSPTGVDSDEDNVTVENVTTVGGNLPAETDGQPDDIDDEVDGEPGEVEHVDGTRGDTLDDDIDDEPVVDSDEK